MLFRSDAHCVTFAFFLNNGKFALNVKVTCVELEFHERDWVDERDVSHQGADIPLLSCRIDGGSKGTGPIGI